MTNQKPSQSSKPKEVSSRILPSLKEAKAQIKAELPSAKDNEDKSEEKE